MKKLSVLQFEKAKSYVKTHARAVERSLFEYEFESGSLETVLKELERYQNEDGGFGHAIEPDFRCSVSSALGTSVGLQHLSRLNIDETSPMVQRAIHYLINTFNNDITGWMKVPREVDDSPRAIWWNYEDPVVDKAKWANPSAEIVGYFHEYSRVVDPDFLKQVTAYAFDCLNYLGAEKHDLMCYIKLAERLPDEMSAQAWKKLHPLIQQCVSPNPEEWAQYVLQPIEVLHNQPRELVELNLDYIIDNQTDEGTWNPTWSWLRYDDHWEQAKQEWKGIITVQNIRLLRDYGRLDSIGQQIV